ncbi:MAG: hypothetical protein AAF734_11025 [Bacteroidota bacterium]
MKYTVKYLFLLLPLLVAACADDDDEVAPNTSNSNGTPIAEGLTSNSEATDSQGNTYTVGLDQVQSDNQDPFVRKVDANGDEVWRYTYESTPVDGRAVLVTIDAEGNPWVVFTVDGGSNDNDYISKKRIQEGAFSNVYANSYGSGGGPKVSIITQIDAERGEIMKGTFVTARTNDGRTNTLEITKIGFNEGNLAFEISSSAWPPGEGTSYQRFPDITDEDRINNRFKIYYEINLALSEITEAVLLNE